MRSTRLALALTGVWLGLIGCDGEESGPSTLSREELMNPETCKGCHPTHYREWKASMHAYAADDPVFLAMNALGQEETKGELGDFCVRCHAPMAVKEGVTDDGMNLDDVPQHLKGVTCYFCHNVVDVQGSHNADIVLADDTTMRSSLSDPARPSAHGVAFSPFHDRLNPESSRFCGSCHDIVTPTGVHLERTYAEYRESAFSHPDSQSFLTCNQCHMDFRTDLAARDPDSDVGLRSVHSHLWPAVDVALTDWPDREAYAKRVECALANGIAYAMDEPASWDLETLTVRIEANAGHRVPSGASQDRRLWLEIVAYDGDDNEVCSLGKVPDDEAVATFVDERPCDANGFLLFRDRIFDENGEETHMFWRAAPSEQYDGGVQSNTLPSQAPFKAGTIPAPHFVEASFQVSFSALGVQRIALRMRMRAMDHDVLGELVDEGHLDDAITDEIRTMTVPGTEAEIKSEGGLPGNLEYTGKPNKNCADFECAFHPDSPDCAGK